MTPKQKRIVGILAIANVILILILVTLGTRPTLPSRAHTPTSSHANLTPCPGDCQWQAAQLLAQAGLGGTVTWTTDRSLDLNISAPLAPDGSADDAAQLIWTAFDVALALQERRCPPFTQVRVTILAHSGQTNAQIHASVSTADLMAFGTGELGEDEFIERVTYTISHVRNE
jgi:hypothetical protein